MRAFWELNRPLAGTEQDAGDAWRAAARRAAQQLRACGSASDRQRESMEEFPPPSAHRGEDLNHTLEERKVVALEAIADAARLWAVRKQLMAMEVFTNRSLSTSIDPS